jgi:hypothetical protein
MFLYMLKLEELAGVILPSCRVDMQKLEDGAVGIVQSRKVHGGNVPAQQWIYRQQRSFTTNFRGSSEARSSCMRVLEDLVDGVWRWLDEWRGMAGTYRGCQRSAAGGLDDWPKMSVLGRRDLSVRRWRWTWIGLCIDARHRTGCP